MYESLINILNIKLYLVVKLLFLKKKLILHVCILDIVCDSEITGKLYLSALMQISVRSARDVKWVLSP